MIQEETKTHKNKITSSLVYRIINKKGHGPFLKMMGGMDPDLCKCCEIKLDRYEMIKGRTIVDTVDIRGERHHRRNEYDYDKIKECRICHHWYGSGWYCDGASSSWSYFYYKPENICGGCYQNATPNEIKELFDVDARNKIIDDERIRLEDVKRYNINHPPINCMICQIKVGRQKKKILSSDETRICDDCRAAVLSIKNNKNRMC